VNDRQALQAALDAAVIAGAKDGSSNWEATAAAAFDGVMPARAGTGRTASFSSPSANTFRGTASASVPATFMNLVGVRTIQVSVTSEVQTKAGDTSCLVALDAGQTKTHSGLTFNGAPSVGLSGCTIRSNSSIDCHGHSTGALASIAVGSVSGCSNPQNGSDAFQDIYAPIKTGILTTKCSAYPGAIWVPGITPPYPAVITVNQPGYTEYHVCGTLTLSGTGTLGSGSSDTVIVVENGSLVLGSNADITTSRTAIVLTGNNTVASSIKFPNGKGQAAALTVSPPTGSANPWRGVSIYQDPSLTYQVDNDWGPGAILNFDGVVYLPNSDVTIHGSSSAITPQCVKIVSSRR
jgi:hypothetical protein